MDANKVIDNTSTIFMAVCGNDIEKLEFYPEANTWSIVYKSSKPVTNIQPEDLLEAIENI